MRHAAIRCEHVAKTFGTTIALDDVSLEIAAGELFFLLGPSGCGKTTLLRLIAGLLAPTTGRIFFDDRDVTELGTERRNAVMCFPGHALWPHMSVRANVLFGLEARGQGREEQRRRVDEVLALVQMEALAERKPNELSGGQQQRVALASAIADHRYTKDEEGHGAALAKSLGVTIKHDESTAALVARFRLMGQIEEGDLPSIDVPILLQRGEVCHFSGAAAHHEIKTITTRINYSGPTASIRIMKGVRWRIGSISVQKVTTDVMTQLDTGDLYVTSKRLFFNGAKKNISIPLGKITMFTVFKDGLQIEKEAGKDPYFLGASDWELAGACLDAAVRKLR